MKHERLREERDALALGSERENLHSPVRCPQCGMDVWATLYEHSYGVSPLVAMQYGYDLGHQYAICLRGHRWKL